MWLVVLLCGSLAAAAPCTSWHNCPPCGNGTVEVDLLAFLSTEAAKQPAADAFFLNVRKAVAIAKSFGALKSDDLLFLHSTMSYLCCYEPRVFTETVFPALDAVRWPPVNVSFATVVCNFDNATNTPPANTTSLILLLSDEAQKQMGVVTDMLESALRAVGLPVVPRATMERYHSTITVVPPEYPTQAALAAMNGAIRDWTSGLGPIEVTSIESVTIPHVFHATRQ